MSALPSDIARSAPEVQGAYEVLLKSMLALFEHSVVGTAAKKRQHALTLAALCVGGMVVARTLPDSEIAEAVRAAALRHGKTIVPAA